MEYAKYSTGSNFEGGVLITSVKPGKEEYENGGGAQKQHSREPLYDPRLGAGVRQESPNTNLKR